MKKVYDVRWSETSEKDLTDIIEYIAGTAPRTPSKYLSVLSEKRQVFILFPIEVVLSPSFRIKESLNIVN